MRSIVGAIGVVYAYGQLQTLIEPAPQLVIESAEHVHDHFESHQNLHSSTSMNVNHHNQLFP